MSKENNIFLIGPMGAGKTTVGRQLAALLHKSFIDSDQVIEDRTGAAIPLIFELEGEEGFRKREMAAIDEVTKMQDIVLATGGGVVLKAENREHLAMRGLVVYLYADIEHLLDRTKKDRNRPLLQTADPRATLLGLFEQREPLYRAIADIQYNTGGGPLKFVVSELLAQIEQRWKAT